MKRGAEINIYSVSRTYQIQENLSVLTVNCIQLKIDETIIPSPLQNSRTRGWPWLFRPLPFSLSSFSFRLVLDMMDSVFRLQQYSTCGFQCILFHDLSEFYKTNFSGGVIIFSCVPLFFPPVREAFRGNFMQSPSQIKGNQPFFHSAAAILYALCSFARNSNVCSAPKNKHWNVIHISFFAALLNENRLLGQQQTSTFAD